jgi:hypothetical protein
MEENRFIKKAFERLAHGIVLQAVRDYQKSYKIYAKLGKDWWRTPEKDRNRIQDCRIFFRSEWFKMLCDYDGARIKKIIENNYNDKIFSSHIVDL